MLNALKAMVDNAVDFFYPSESSSKARTSRQVSRPPCEDVPIFLEEFDEREFQIGVQTIAYMSNLSRLLRGQWDCLAQ
jgi:hypothetical protein